MLREVVHDQVDKEEIAAFKSGDSKLKVKSEILLTLAGLSQRTEKPESQTPSPRAGHSLTLMTTSPTFDDKEVSLKVMSPGIHDISQQDTQGSVAKEQPPQQVYLLFGGANHEQGFLDDLYLLRQVQDELVWDPIKIFSSLSGPVARYEHSALCVKRRHVESQELLVMFGAGNEGPLGDCWVYNMDAASWCELEIAGSTVPAPRVIKSVGYVEETSRVYVFGGGLRNNVPVDDCNTYCLDLNSLHWVMVSGERALHPTKRLGHSLTMIGGNMYLFGGLCGDQTLDDLWVFDTACNKWSEIKDTTGPRPSPRCAHSCICIGNNKLLITGGMSSASNPPAVFDSAHILDTDSLTWTKITFEELKRLDHTCTPINTRQALVFGGMDLKNVFQDANLLNISS